MGRFTSKNASWRIKKGRHEIDQLKSYWREFGSA